MIRRTLLLGAPLLAAVMLLLTPTDSQAQRWGGGWRGGWHSGYGSGYTPYSGSWSGYNPYSSGWGYSYPSYSYSPGYSYPSYSYYSYPSYGYSYPSYSYGTASPSSSSQYLTGTTGYQSFYPSESTENGNQIAYVRLQVPADAEVWFDGQWDQKTQQTGSDRLYVTPPLDPNKDYYYEIRARWNDNGREMERTKRLPIHAGDRASLRFGSSDENTAPSDTSRPRDITTEPQRRTDINDQTIRGGAVNPAAPTNRPDNTVNPATPANRPDSTVNPTRPGTPAPGPGGRPTTTPPNNTNPNRP